MELLRGEDLSALVARTGPLAGPLVLMLLEQLCHAVRSEERRVGKECRSLCDWSSDVCSSDLDGAAPRRGPLGAGGAHGAARRASRADAARAALSCGKIGRASCRERV